ncbi:MAG: hypothetical protein ACRCTY_07810, partial [Candidatus Adiutrix sp.]
MKQLTLSTKIILGFASLFLTVTLLLGFIIIEIVSMRELSENLSARITQTFGQLSKAEEGETIDFASLNVAGQEISANFVRESRHIGDLIFRS